MHRWMAWREWIHLASLSYVVTMTTPIPSPIPIPLLLAIAIAIAHHCTLHSIIQTQLPVSHSSSHTPLLTLTETCHYQRHDELEVG